MKEAAFGFGLGAADEARLFTQFGVLVDSYAWTAHGVTSYGRCPGTTGAFVTTAVSGFVVKDNDDTRTTTLSAGTTIAAGGFLVIEEAQLGFGLGSAAAARLFDAAGALVDSYTWTAHAAVPMVAARRVRATSTRTPRRRRAPRTASSMPTR